MNKFSHLLKRCDHFILGSSLGLSMLGLISITSITRNSEPFLSGEVFIQSAALIIGISAAAVILMMGYRYFTDPEIPIYVFSILLLLLVYVPGLGTSVNGSRSWIYFGALSFQPSEIVKISFILLMASYLSRSKTSLSGIRGLISTALYGLPFILLVTKEDFGSGCVFCAIWLFMVFCSGLEVKMIGRLVLTFAALLPMLYFFLADYQKDRVDAFLHPGDLDLPGNYQVWHSKVAIGSGGLCGKGWMEGTQSHLGFLPVPESDFIFAATVEELGFIGGLIIILLFAVLIFHSLEVSRFAKDLQGALTGAGLVGMFLFQTFENLAMTMGIMPVTGITLPFMSYGGSSMVSAWTGIGLLLSVSTRQKI